MVLDFLLPQSQLNLLSVFEKNQDDFVNLKVPLKAVNQFQYVKNNRYQKGKYLLKQVVKNALSIAEVLYSEY